MPYETLPHAGVVNAKSGILIKSNVTNCLEDVNFDDLLTANKDAQE